MTEKTYRPTTNPTTHQRKTMAAAERPSQDRRRSQAWESFVGESVPERRKRRDGPADYQGSGNASSMDQGF